ncbi:carbon-nitrogen hydrolase family protein [Mycolicibacterium austroafricanum]|uniref:carbon-nitrogen hydrolase family protein n=1 Tax=Mycolicibacterium austroafricanum TaxID=39687 RepID=UPI001CA3865D|nr:carbon-nitrogen hydrolase family protein [Mycolicibacterium austroafricanum]QZT54507.1 carbon-nitrogen hydrolase family protein [Mycolicibacterium austroafricanum]
MAPSTYTLAMAQPRRIAGPDGSANVAHAVRLVEQAAGADLVCFPEFSPGPVRAHDTFYDAGPALAAAARACDVNIVWSRTERCDDGRNRLVVYVTGRDGDPVLRYARTHPATIPPGEDGELVSPADTFGNFEVDGIPMGIVVCSEMWTPEIARIVALRGAEIILSPAGGGFTSLTRNWQIIVSARAIENLCYIGLTNNLWGDEQGAAMITGPEHPLAHAGRSELVTATVDLDRLRWLRAHDDSMAEPKAFDSIPGLLRARRPELYGELVAPQADAYDYANGHA